MSKSKLFISNAGFEFYLGDINEELSSTGAYLASDGFNPELLCNLLLDPNFWMVEGADAYKTDIIQLTGCPQHFLGLLLANGFELEVLSDSPTKKKIQNDCKKVSFVLKCETEERHLGNFYSTPYMNEDKSFVTFATHYCDLNLKGLLVKVISGSRILSHDPNEKCLLQKTSDKGILGRENTANLFRMNFATT